MGKVPGKSMGEARKCVRCYHDNNVSRRKILANTHLPSLYESTFCSVMVVMLKQPHPN